jgi:hypothetical protein
MGRAGPWTGEVGAQNRSQLVLVVSGIAVNINIVTLHHLISIDL